MKKSISNFIFYLGRFQEAKILNHMIDEHFAKQHHQMQEFCNNCFWSKKCNMNLCQAETGKQEQGNITVCCCYIEALLLYSFLADEGLCYVFLTQNNCCRFLESDSIILQTVHQSYTNMPVLRGFSLVFFNHLSFFTSFCNNLIIR